MTGAHLVYAQGQIAATNAEAGQAASGVNCGTSGTIGGVNQAAALERQANRVTNDAAREAPVFSGEAVGDDAEHLHRIRVGQRIARVGYEVRRPSKA